MALIPCPECSHQVSSAAVACPQCGNPIAGAAGGETAGTPPATGRDISKTLKVHAFLSWFMQFAGVGGFIFLIATRAANDPDIGPSLVLTIVLFLGGFVWQVVTKIVEWWHHRQR